MGDVKGMFNEMRCVCIVLRVVSRHIALNVRQQLIN